MAKGSSFLAKAKRGERLCASQALLAKCAECNADYVDGKFDCNADGIRGTFCPLYPWMPYGIK